MRPSSFRTPSVLALLAVAVNHGTAAATERAVQTPSAAAAAPTTVPPGMENAFVWGGDFASHLQGEVTKSSGTQTKVTAFDDTDTNLYANYSTWLSLYGNLHLERNRDDQIDGYFTRTNAFFRSEGLTAQQLFAALRPTDELSVYGGKIHTNFGSAYANVPGNFYNFATDYEQTERIGVGMEYRLPPHSNQLINAISLETHYLDTSLLSTSLISQPKVSDPTPYRAWRYRPYTYGAGNTGTFDNWSLALLGGRPETGLTYQLSFEIQSTRDPAGKTEAGGSLGLMYDPGGGDGMPLSFISQRLGVVPFVEYAQFNNFGGTAGQRERFLTGGLAFHYVRWELDVAGGMRQGVNVPQSDGSLASAFDRQQSLSLNYKLLPYPEIVVGAGVNHVDVAGQGSSWSAGPSLSLATTF